MTDLATIMDTVQEHVKKYGPTLNYVSFPVYDGCTMRVLTEEGQRKLDGDTLKGLIEIERLQSEVEKSKYGAIGWMYAEACRLADEGKDIRKELVPDIMDRYHKDMEEACSQQ